MSLWHRSVGKLYRSVVGKLWATIMLLVAVVLLIVGVFLLQYVDIWFKEDNTDNTHQVKVLFVLTAIIGFLLSTFFCFLFIQKNSTAAASTKGCSGIDFSR